MNATRLNGVQILLSFGEDVKPASLATILLLTACIVMSTIRPTNFEASLVSHRFFISPNWITPPTVNLSGETARQIKTVLRMNPGDEIVVLDNSGTEWRVRLTAVGKNEMRGEIVAQQLARGEPALNLTLYQGTLKGQKFEWVLQKGTELGVACFVPTICQRSVVRRVADLEKKRARWEQIIREAAEQCGRGKLPVLAPPIWLTDALIHAQPANLILMPWEEAGGVSLKDVLRTAKPTGIALFIGPEGGFTSEETALAQQAQAQLITLGPRILRAETAGLAAIAAIMHELGEWG